MTCEDDSPVRGVRDEAIPERLSFCNPVEALKDCLRQKKATVNDVCRYAKICRASNVIRPYMEAL